MTPEAIADDESRIKAGSIAGRIPTGDVSHSTSWHDGDGGEVELT